MLDRAKPHRYDGTDKLPGNHVLMTAGTTPEPYAGFQRGRSGIQRKGLNSNRKVNVGACQIDRLPTAFVAVSRNWGPANVQNRS